MGGNRMRPPRMNRFQDHRFQGRMLQNQPPNSPSPRMQHHLPPPLMSLPGPPPSLPPTQVPPPPQTVIDRYYFLTALIIGSTFETQIGYPLFSLYVSVCLVCVRLQTTGHISLTRKLIFWKRGPWDIFF